MRGRRLGFNPPPSDMLRVTLPYPQDQRKSLMGLNQSQWPSPLCWSYFKGGYAGLSAASVDHNSLLSLGSMLSRITISVLFQAIAHKRNSGQDLQRGWCYSSRDGRSCIGGQMRESLELPGTNSRSYTLRCLRLRLFRVSSSDL